MLRLVDYYFIALHYFCCALAHTHLSLLLFVSGIMIANNGPFVQSDSLHCI